MEEIITEEQILDEEALWDWLWDWFPNATTDEELEYELDCWDCWNND